MAKKKQYNPKEDRAFHITRIIYKGCVFFSALS